MNGFGLRRDVFVPLYRLTYTELRKYMVELSGNSMSIFTGGREAGRDREELRGRDQGTGRQAIKEAGRQLRRQTGN